MSPEAQSLSLLRSELSILFEGSFFVFIALIAFAIAAIRRRSGVRLLVWTGVWSFLFGSNLLVQSQPIIAALPSRIDFARNLYSVCASYLVIVAAAFAFLELTCGALRRLLQILLDADILVAIGGISGFLITGRADTFLLWNELLAVVGLLALLLPLAIPALSRRFLILGHHRVLTVGSFIFAAEALWVNIGRPFNIQVPSIYSSLGFAALLLSFAYVGLDLISANERRLLVIDKELQIARELQFSILPAEPPKISRLDIAAAYEPMTSVAGDFYEFLPLDENRVGFLVADVSGHGVPAALIASMIKVATQSLNGCASDPSEVLRRLGRILHTNLRGQFVSAAYLWVDVEKQTVAYSAAGHPPLLRWSKASGTLTHIESNGLLFGVLPDAEYPACSVPLVTGDRFLMYTDGVTEAENQNGEQFGDRRLEQVLREAQSLTASETLARLREELRSWQPSSRAQQDDITIVIIDLQ